MTFAVYVPLEGWDELNNVAATLFVLHAIIYCFLLSTIVKLIFPRIRVAANGNKPKQAAANPYKTTTPESYQLQDTQISSVLKQL